MQLKKEPNRSERKLRKKLNRRKKEGRAALHSKRRQEKKNELDCKRKRKEKKNIALKYRETKLMRRKKEGRAALHSKRRKIMLFLEPYLLVVRRKEGRWEASISAIPGSTYWSSEGKEEDGKHRSLQFLVLFIGCQRERWKKGSIGSRFCFLCRHP